MPKLFTYGTLQSKIIQQEVLGRALKGKKAKLEGFLIEEIAITAPEEREKLGINHYPVLVFSGNFADIVEGIMYEVSQEELLKTDEYEGDEYQRIEVYTVNEIKVWVYSKSI